MTTPPFPSTPAANELPTPPRALPRGTQVERFEIARVIVDTASSIEYVAIDRAADIEVVLREYMPQRLGRRKGDALRPLMPTAAVALSLGLHAFSEEGRMLASIDHPSLVRVLGMIEANDTLYMVMPLYDGMRLQHARQSMSVPPDEHLLRPLIDGLLSALEAVHRTNLLHGAVSPGNILLVSDERAVLLGPDLARHIIADDLVESLMTAVGPSFEAPEQLSPSPHNPLGPWTDMYGLAETIRFCISGELRPPHVVRGERREPMAQMVKRLFGDPPSAVYSPALLNTLEAALEPRANARPQNTQQFRELLAERPQAPANISPTPTPAAVPTPKPTLKSMPVGAPGAGASIPPINPPVMTSKITLAPTAPVAADTGRLEPAFNTVRDRDTIDVDQEQEQILTVGAAAAASARSFLPEPPPLPPATPPAKRRSGPWIAVALILVLAVALWGGWRGGWWGGESATSDAMSSPPGAEPTSTVRAPEATAPPDALPPAAATPAPTTMPVEPQTAAVVTPVPPPTPMPAPPPVVARTLAPAIASTSAPATATSPPVAREHTDKPKLANPRDACNGRTQFALYRCMQAQCEQRVWTHHPQCELLRATDQVE